MSAVIELAGAAVERAGRRVLGPLDLTVTAGEGLIVAGSNGAGKTTLLLLLLGLLRAASGSATVLGARVGSREWGRIRCRVGYVNQESVRTDLPITAREVVEIGFVAARPTRDERERRAARAMDRAGCRALASRAYRELSGGEKQRVAIARCLAQDPMVLLLDEPTSFLDPAGAADLVSLLVELNRSGLTVLAVSHELDRFGGWPLLHLAAGRVVGGTTRA